VGRLAAASWRQYPSWARGPARIEGDEIILDEGRAEEYYLFEPTDLMFDLAALAADPANPDSRGALAFVRRYGLLWHGKEALGSRECREPLSDWWEESYALAVTADLYVRLKESARSGSAESLRAGPVDYAAFEDMGLTEEDDDLIEFSSLFLAETITMRLEGCDLGISSSLGLDVQPREPLTFLLTQNPPDLLTAAYAQLAMAMVNRAPMQECLGCGKTFIPESGKQKYCTKSCASTTRWRRWQARQSRHG
jgi:hypothetical protein